MRILRSEPYLAKVTLKQALLDQALSPVIIKQI